VGVVQGSFLALHAVAPGLADRILAVAMRGLGLRRAPAAPTSGTVDAPEPWSNAVTGGWRAP
jgi:hypothetical protein